MPQHWVGRKHSEETKAKMRAARQGANNSFFGKTHSEESRKKISENRRGKCLGEANHMTGGALWTKDKREALGRVRVERGVVVGEKNPNYVNGSSYNKQKRDTCSDYRAWRKAVFERDNYACQFCGKRGGDLEADHIKPYRFFPELRIDLDNGRTLCLPCHRTTFKDVQKYRQAVKLGVPLTEVGENWRSDGRPQNEW